MFWYPVTLLCVACKYKRTIGVLEGLKAQKNGPGYTCMQLCPDILACNCSKLFTRLMTRLITRIFTEQSLCKCIKFTKINSEQGRCTETVVKTCYFNGWFGTIWQSRTYVPTLENVKNVTRLYLHTSVSGYTCMQAYLGGNTKRGNWVVPKIEKTF